MARDKPELTLGVIRHLQMPRHHDIRSEDIDLNRLGAVLAVAYEKDLHSLVHSSRAARSNEASLRTRASSCAICSRTDLSTMGLTSLATLSRSPAIGRLTSLIVT